MKRLEKESFENMLQELCFRLTKEVREGRKFADSLAFEERIREILVELVRDYGVEVDLDPHPHVFPDIILKEFGIEVKFTKSDSWRSVGNSVFESTRDGGVQNIYVVFGKMGGVPEVDWDRYEDCIIHVRTSHVPRFEVQIHAEESLFDKIGIGYREFSELPLHERMEYIRTYARGRLKEGERLWWLEDEKHSLPIQARLYMSLEQAEKRRLRAEAALLCPQIVKPSRQKHKYDDVTLFLLTYHGVLCPQARDLFSAGSVAMRSDNSRGGNYVLRALEDIEEEMREAARTMDDALFIEYWGESVPVEQRISRWLEKADEYAQGWVPSASLFITKQSS